MSDNHSRRRFLIGAAGLAATPAVAAVAWPASAALAGGGGRTVAKATTLAGRRRLGRGSRSPASAWAARP
ncbi:ubiquinol-cytochrome c reductase iron-sulfur subunit N-terminal domain-containing protein [Actinoplanes sp. GCM10030250]|uniref:ubiquinol-cytochrome c reductase iron-sulfur subunit N-terminal domain-containing protein n=1 Tax=Actinoplanes sp. GCM10030250 TaxID=3273376 RepID=UPI00360FCB0C